MDYRMPLYIQLQDIIIKKIEERLYLPGEVIPSERRMAELYGVNRMTVKRAINKLVEQGYLYRKAGAGTFVAKRDNKKIDLYYTNYSGNTGITAVLRDSGITTSNKVLGIGKVENSSFLNYRLGLDMDDSLWGLHRIRYGNQSPFAVEYTYVPEKYFEDLNSFDFSSVSLYDYMNAKGHLPVYFNKSLIVCNANEKVAKLLNVKKGAAIFKVEYGGADKDFNIVEYTKAYMNPEVAEFRFNAKADEG